MPKRARYVAVNENDGNENDGNSERDDEDTVEEEKDDDDTVEEETDDDDFNEDQQREAHRLRVLDLNEQADAAVIATKSNFDRLIKAKETDKTKLNEAREQCWVAKANRCHVCHVFYHGGKHTSTELSLSYQFAK